MIVRKKGLFEVTYTYSVGNDEGFQNPMSSTRMPAVVSTYRLALGVTAGHRQQRLYRPLDELRRVHLVVNHFQLILKRSRYSF